MPPDSPADVGVLGHDHGQVGAEASPHRLLRRHPPPLPHVIVEGQPQRPVHELGQPGDLGCFVGPGRSDPEAVTGLWHGSGLGWSVLPGGYKRRGMRRTPEPRGLDGLELAVELDAVGNGLGVELVVAVAGPGGGRDGLVLALGAAGDDDGTLALADAGDARHVPADASR